MAGRGARPGSPLRGPTKTPVPSGDDLSVNHLPESPAIAIWANKIAQAVNDLADDTVTLVVANITQAASFAKDNAQLARLILLKSDKVATAVFELAEMVETLQGIASEDPPPK